MIRLDALFEWAGRKRKTKLLGRGPSSGHGKTSGRGHKGDGSRSGYKRRFGYEGGGVPLYRRVPCRGFSHRRFDKNIAVLTTRMIDQAFMDGESVTLDALKAKKMIASKVVGVKVILKGEIKKTLVWKDPSVTLSLGAQNLVAQA